MSPDPIYSHHQIVIKTIIEGGEIVSRTVFALIDHESADSVLAIPSVALDEIEDGEIVEVLDEDQYTQIMADNSLPDIAALLAYLEIEDGLNA